jgi:hypothetical protein
LYLYERRMGSGIYDYGSASNIVDVLLKSLTNLPDEYTDFYTPHVDVRSIQLEKQTVSHDTSVGSLNEALISLNLSIM